MSMRHLITIFTTASLALLTSCAITPKGVPESVLPKPDIAYTEFTLDNGLRLIVHEDHSTPIVAVNVWYHVGSKNEPVGRTGFAHLFEHLMFNGSEHHRDEFFRPLEEVGATGMNGTTNEDRTNYFANVPTPAFDRLLWLESDRMGHLLGAITQDKLDEQRGVVQNEKRQRENEPYGRIWGQIPKLAYPAGHPYSWSTIGSMADLNAATLDDVHEWFQTWYGASNATIVVAGDVTPEHALERVTHYFGAIPAGPTLERPKRWEAPIPDKRRAELADNVPHARIYRVYNVAANFTPDLIHLQLASTILGSGKGSRLHERLVWEEQLATSVSTFVAAGEIGSQLYLVATLKPESDTARVEAILDQELAKLRTQGPTDAELQRVRTSLYASTLRGLERVGGFGGKSDQLASAAVLAGDPAYWSQELDWLQNATPTDIRQSLIDWTNGGHLTVVVTPEPAHKTTQDSVDRQSIPAVTSAPALALPKLESRTLANGLTVQVARRPGAPVTEYRWFTQGGQATDPQGREGLGTLTMDLLDEAAGGQDGLTLSRLLSGHGAHLNTSSSLDHFSVSLSVVKGLEEQPLQIFADVLTRPDLPAEELERRRTLLLARIRQEQSSPFAMGMRALPPLLYGSDHPYGRPMTGSGTRASASAITLEDVRSHAQSLLQPQESTLLIVGDLSMDEAIASLPSRIHGWTNVDGSRAPRPAVPMVAKRAKTTIHLLNRPDAPQSVILAGQLVGHRAIPENLALETANSLFGGLFTSRLNMNLREDKHWAYGAGSAVIDTNAQRPWLIYTRVQSDKTAASMREIRYELSQLRRRNSIDKTELRHATRNRALKLPGQNETTGQISSSLARLLTQDLPVDYFDTLASRLDALTPEQLVNAANNQFAPDELQWVIVGDLEQIRKDIEALGWADVVELTETP